MTTLIEQLRNEYRAARSNRDQHHNGTATPGDDPGWSFYNGLMEGIHMAAKAVGILSPSGQLLPDGHVDRKTPDEDEAGSYR